MRKEILIICLCICMVVAIILIYNCKYGLHDQYLSYDKYRQLKNGMTYEQCVKVIGKEPHFESSTDEKNDFVMKSYSYEDEKSNVALIFMNDKLYSKAQSGLK